MIRFSHIYIHEQEYIFSAFHIYVSVQLKVRRVYFLKTPTPMTPFDEATASGLRMLKLFLPLFPPATQSMLAVFIKFIELQNVLHHQTPVSYDALSACDFSSGRGIENLFQDNADSIF